MGDGRGSLSGAEDPAQMRPSWEPGGGSQVASGGIRWPVLGRALRFTCRSQDAQVMAVGLAGGVAVIKCRHVPEAPGTEQGHTSLLGDQVLPEVPCPKLGLWAGWGGWKECHPVPGPGLAWEQPPPPPPPLGKEERSVCRPSGGKGLPGSTLSRRSLFKGLPRPLVCTRTNGLRGPACAGVPQSPCRRRSRYLFGTSQPHLESSTRGQTWLAFPLAPGRCPACRGTSISFEGVTVQVSDLKQLVSIHLRGDLERP